MPQIGAFTFNPENGDILDAQGQAVTVLRWEDIGVQDNAEIPRLMVAMVETLQKNQSVNKIHVDLGVAADVRAGLGNFEPNDLVSILAACERLKMFSCYFHTGGENGEDECYEAICDALATHPSIQEVRFDLAFDYHGDEDSLGIDSLVEMLRNPNITTLDVGRKRLNEDDLIALIEVINGPDSRLEVFESDPFPDYDYLHESGPHVMTQSIPFFDDPGVMCTEKVVDSLLALCRNPLIRQFNLTPPRAWGEKSSQAIDAELRRRMCTRPLALSQGDCDFVLQDSAALSDKEIFGLGTELTGLIDKAVSMDEDSAAAKAALMDKAKDHSVMGRLNQDYVMAIALDAGTGKGLAACIEHARGILHHDQAGLAFYDRMQFILEKIFIALLDKKQYFDALVFASAMDASKVEGVPIVGALVSHVPALSAEQYEFNAWIDSTNRAINEGDRELFDSVLKVMFEIAEKQLELGMHLDMHLLVFRQLEILMAGILRRVESNVRSIGFGPSPSFSSYRLFEVANHPYFPAISSLAVDAAAEGRIGIWVRCDAASRPTKRMRSDGAGPADAAGPADGRLFSRTDVKCGVNADAASRPAKKERTDDAGPADASASSPKTP